MPDVVCVEEWGLGKDIWRRDTETELCGDGEVVLLSVEDILINWTEEKCSHIEMFTL